MGQGALVRVEVRLSLHVPLVVESLVIALVVPLVGVVDGLPVVDGVPHDHRLVDRLHRLLVVGKPSIPSILLVVVGQ